MGGKGLSMRTAGRIAARKKPARRKPSFGGGGKVCCQQTGFKPILLNKCRGPKAPVDASCCKGKKSKSSLPCGNNVNSFGVNKRKAGRTKAGRKAAAANGLSMRARRRAAKIARKPSFGSRRRRATLTAAQKAEVETEVQSAETHTEQQLKEVETEAVESQARDVKETADVKEAADNQQK